MKTPAKLQCASLRTISRTQAICTSRKGSPDRMRVSCSKPHPLECFQEKHVPAKAGIALFRFESATNQKPGALHRFIEAVKCSSSNGPRLCHAHLARATQRHYLTLTIM